MLNQKRKSVKIVLSHVKIVLSRQQSDFILFNEEEAEHITS